MYKDSKVIPMDGSGGKFRIFLCSRLMVGIEVRIVYILRNSTIKFLVNKTF